MGIADITPEQFRAFLRAAREEKVNAFELGEFKVTFFPEAIAEPPAKQPAPITTVPAPVTAATPGDTPKGPVFGNYTEADLFGDGGAG